MVDGSPGSRQFSKMFLVLCISSKALGRRLSNGQKWFQDYRLTFLTPHTISISFKAVGVGEDVKTRSFGADGKAAQNCLPILAPTPSSGIGNPFLGSLLWSKTLKGLNSDRRGPQKWSGYLGPRGYKEALSSLCWRDRLQEGSERHRPVWLSGTSLSNFLLRL